MRCMQCEKKGNLTAREIFLSLKPNGSGSQSEKLGILLLEIVLILSVCGGVNADCDEANDWDWIIDGLLWQFDCCWFNE